MRGMLGVGDGDGRLIDAAVCAGSLRRAAWGGDEVGMLIDNLQRRSSAESL